MRPGEDIFGYAERMSGDEAAGQRFSLSKSPEEFERKRERALRERGHVLPGLAEQEISIVNGKEPPFNYQQKTTLLKKEVLDYAEKHGILGVMTNEETGGKGEINISKKSIKKSLMIHP